MGKLLELGLKGRVTKGLQRVDKKVSFTIHPKGAKAKRVKLVARR